MKNIYLRVRGGLGNQMFQFAFALFLKLKFGADKIYLDTKEYKHYFRPFELNLFSLPENVFLTNDRLKYDFDCKLFHFKQFIFRKIFKRKYKKLNKIDKKLWKKGFAFCGDYCECPKDNFDGDVFLYGYFQNGMLLDEIRPTLFDVFSIKSKSERLKSFISKIKKNSISVSVRQLDDKEIKNGGQLTTFSKGFYEKLIKEIILRRGLDCQIVVSSNRIEKLIEEKWFSDFPDVLYVQGLNAVEQIELLKNCQDFVMSNSTFSWWIAYLGSYGKDSLIYAPSVWYDNIKICDTKLSFEGVEFFNG